MAKKHIGRCALCGKEGKLSFEHIPPQSAFNSSPAKAVPGSQLLEDTERLPWDIDRLRYTNLQQGMGLFSICADCNNKTGAWYGNQYKDLAYGAHYAVSQAADPETQGLGIKEVYPLRLIKQIISMFCSINNFDDPRMDPLRDFVLNRAAVGLDKTKYKLCMYFTESEYMKYSSLSVVMNLKGPEIEAMALSEITAYPLGFVLYFDPTENWEYVGIDITDFANLGYDDVRTIELPFCIKEVNNMFPTDYRTKEEILKCIKDTQSRMAELQDSTS